MKALNDKQKSLATAATGLRTAVSILDKWNATAEQVQSILRVSRATYFKARKTALESIKLDSDQLDRISVILNIHAALRVVFDNPDNVYGFMQMTNNNRFFNGRSPLDTMSNGSFPAIYETFKRVDTLRNSGW